MVVVTINYLNYTSIVRKYFFKILLFILFVFSGPIKSSDLNIYSLGYFDFYQNGESDALDMRIDKRLNKSIHV